MLDFINRFYLKYNTVIARERTKYEEERFWAAAARNIAPATLEEHKSGRYGIINGKTFFRTIIIGIPPINRING